MSQRSERVRQWRRRLKKRIVDAMGGECVICRYNKCLCCLTLHHLHPEEKEFTFGKIRTSPKNWDRIASELRKCVLVCNRCHTEIHEDMAEVPRGAARFNEKYAIYKEDIHDKCPICGGNKHKKMKTCSKICAGKKKRKIDWDKVDLKKLLNELNTYSAVAKLLGISSAAVRKRARKIGIR